MREGHHSIDMRKIAAEILSPEMLCDVFGNRGRAIHAGDDGQIIAGPRTSPRTAIKSHEGQRLFSRGSLQRPKGLTNTVIAPKITHPKIVHMHMISRVDLLRCKPDDLTIFQQRITLGQGAKCHFVAGRNRGLGFPDLIPTLDSNAFLECSLEHGNLILRVKLEPDIIKWHVHE